MQTEILNVTGMVCDSCASKVTGVISEIRGVSDVEVSLKQGEAKVQYDEQQASVEQLKTVVRDSGYGVDGVSTTRDSQGKGCCG